MASTRVSIRRSSWAAGGAGCAAIAAQAFGDRREVIADDGGVERALVREVVVDHRLVDAGAAGDAVDGGGGKAASAEFVGGRRQDTRAGSGGGAAAAALVDGTSHQIPN